MDGRRLFFDEKGIYNGVFVMKDRETGTTWSHYTGEALDGPLKGKRLEFLRVERGTLAELSSGREGVDTVSKPQLHWKKKPQVVGKRAELKGPLRDDFAQTLEGSTAKGGLPAHTHGLGVAAGAAQRFYSLEALYADGLISDTLGPVPVVILLQDGSSTAAAYSRCVAGETRTMTVVQHEGASALRDDEGTTWSARGLGVAGPRAGEQLTSLRSMITDWYGWAAFNPSTTVYTP